MASNSEAHNGFEGNLPMILDKEPLRLDGGPMLEPGEYHDDPIAIIGMSESR